MSVCLSRGKLWYPDTQSFLRAARYVRNYGMQLFCSVFLIETSDRPGRMAQPSELLTDPLFPTAGVAVSEIAKPTCDLRSSASGLAGGFGSSNRRGGIDG